MTFLIDNIALILIALISGGALLWPLLFRAKNTLSTLQATQLLNQGKVTMYTTGVCPYCNMAERLLQSKGVAEIEKIRVDLEPEQRAEMMEKTGRRTVPQIYIGETHVGGFDDLSALDRAGELEPLLRG